MRIISIECIQVREIDKILQAERRWGEGHPLKKLRTRAGRTRRLTVSVAESEPYTSSG